MTLTDRSTTLGASLGLLLLALPLAPACASSGPPPRPAEVPIDNSPPSGTLFLDAAPAPELGSSTTVPTSGSQPGAATPGETPDSAHAATAPADQAAPPSAPAAPKPPVPRAQRLLPADCTRLLDKYVTLVAISQGVAANQVKNVMPMMRQQVQNDAAYTHVQGTCVKENSKKQYACAMKAASIDDWKTCLQ